METEETTEGVIYIAQNTKNEKVYIGQAQKFVKAKDKWIKHGSHRRWTQHMQDAKNRIEKGSTYLTKAILKYGAESFIVQDLHECPISELNMWEAHFVKEFDANNPQKGYNLTTGGDNYTRSDETLERMSVGMKDSYAARANAKDEANIQKYSQLDIDKISIIAVDKESKWVKIQIHTKAGKFNICIRPLYKMKDAVDRACAISNRLVDPSKIKLSQTVSNILK